MKRPPGITILGFLCMFAGGGALFSPLDRPLLSFGIIHHGMVALCLRIGADLLGLYLGYGLLKLFRHTWYLYFVVVCMGTISLGLNVLHEPKVWELCLLLQQNANLIPRLVQVTLDTHYVLIAVYTLTALYLYTHKYVFWGKTE